MRTFVFIALLGACAGSVRPVVVNKLSALPGDPEKRDAVLDSANAQPGPEQRKPLPPKMRKVETAAATAAAVLGILFSKSNNVTLGVGTLIDENLFVEPPAPQKRDKDGDKAETKDQVPADTGTAALVPWVRLK